MSLLIEVLIAIVAALVLSAVIGICLALGLLIREDIRRMMKESREKRDQRKAQDEERRQAVLAGERVWSTTVFHHGVDRVSGTKITGSSTIDTPQAKKLWAQMEKQLQELRENNRG